MVVEERNEQRSVYEETKGQFARAGKFIYNAGKFLWKYGKPLVKAGLALASGGTSVAVDIAKTAGKWLLKKAGDGIKSLVSFGWNLQKAKHVKDTRPFWKKHKIALGILLLILSPFLLMLLPMLAVQQGMSLVTRSPVP